MVEYQILSEIISGADLNECMTGVYNGKYDLDKMIDRCNELSEEFLKPYAISPDSKE